MLTLQKALLVKMKHHIKQEIVTPFTRKVKPQVIQSLLTFDSMYRTLKCDHSFESYGAVLYCGAVCLFTFPMSVILENFTISGLAL